MTGMGGGGQSAKKKVLLQQKIGRACHGRPFLSVRCSPRVPEGRAESADPGVEAPVVTQQLARLEGLVGGQLMDMD